MDRVHEIDLDERTVTVGPGVNMLKLNELLRPHGVMYPDNPASYSCALVGGRIGTNGWSLLGSRFGHMRDLVISFEIVLPTGEIIRVGEGGGEKIRSSSSGYRLKELFMGAQGTLGIVTEATLELVKRPEAEFSAFWMQRSFDQAWRTGGELMRSGFATHRRRDAVRRAQDRLPAPRRRGVHPAARLGDGRRRVRALRQPRRGAAGGQGDDADRARRRAASTSATRSRSSTGRPGTTATRRRCTAGRRTARSRRCRWHCEDAAIPYPKVPEIRERWHAIVDRLVERHPIFDDWGMFGYTNGPNKPWGDVPVRDRRRHLGAAPRRRDVGRLGRREARDRARLARGRRHRSRRRHGSARAGEVDLVPLELGGAYDVMQTIKRALDPNNVMNPGKYGLDSAYEDG